MIHVHVLISGQVQGVGLRYHTRVQAQELGLSGWVRNLPDGRVEAVFEGSKEKIREMVEWCKQGSPSAVAKKVEVRWEESEGLEGFEVLPTR